MQLLDYDGLRAKGIKFSREHLWKLYTASKFPKPVKIGAARNAWVESEIDAWIDRRIAERDSSKVESA